MQAIFIGMRNLQACERLIADGFPGAQVVEVRARASASAT
jgi:hypothetical protein